MSEPLPFVIRVARRMPGYRIVRRRAVRLLRSSRMLERALGLSRIRRGRPPRFLAGTPRPAGSGAVDELPIVLFVALELIGPALESTLAVATAIQAESLGFRAFFVTDRPSFAALRHCGIPCEQVVTREAWAALQMPTGWDEYVAARIASVRDRYVAAAVVPVPAAGFSAADTASLAGTLRACAPPVHA
ncbi:MAG: hypothetical protein JWM93_2707 [Frankiales bacterium]|nr:hypothetical protein [Frankiales bacterium]